MTGIGAQNHIDVRDAVIVVGRGGHKKAEALIERSEIGLAAQPHGMVRVVAAATRKRFPHQRACEALPACGFGDRDAADLDALLLGKRDQSQTAGERAIYPQQQMLRALVEPVEIGIGAALLDDKDRLPKAQQLVQLRRTQLLEPVPLQADLIAGSHAHLAIRL
jgi:hypothetical protein